MAVLIGGALLAEPGVPAEWGPLAVMPSTGGDQALSTGVLRISDRCVLLEGGSETDCDEVGACVVWLSVPDEASIPAFLVESGIVSYRTDKVPTGANAGMAVLQNGIFGQGVIVPKG